MLSQFKHAAARTARRAGLLCGGAVLMLVGLAFLTASLWLHLSLVYGAVFAATVIGTAYFGIGLLIVGIAAAGEKRMPVEEHPPVHVHKRPPPADGPAIVEAFLYGLQAGTSAKKS
ncbi:phage holin family protein [Neptunicoccus cionae]|uniref:Phage holin family protein n=1 Tax=Neptunicoccus cionae TaxID=2035344 RepID=A0A916VQR9_9RHOB|nr:phage holin family protein [Amylibacter cionae]GGA19284.1 hypothetical protein GCM10011498_20180 [Amylibacter cionae]